MADAQEVALNGAYYGPPVPPRHDRHRNRRGSGCCPCCLITNLIKLILPIVITIATTTSVFWLLIHPSKVKIYVEDALLTQFNLANGNTLHYNLSLDISVKNPNKRIGIYYDALEVGAYYEGERFDSVPFTGFYQGRKNTTMLYATFRGQKPMALGGPALFDFNNEKRVGAFQIDLKIYSRVRFVLGPFKSLHYEPNIECELAIPLDTDDRPFISVFTRTKCDIHTWWPSTYMSVEAISISDRFQQFISWDSSSIFNMLWFFTVLCVVTIVNRWFFN